MMGLRVQAMQGQERGNSQRESGGVNGLKFLIESMNYLKKTIRGNELDKTYYIEMVLEHRNRKFQRRCGYC